MIDFSLKLYYEFWIVISSHVIEIPAISKNNEIVCSEFPDPLQLFVSIAY